MASTRASTAADRPDRATLVDLHRRMVRIRVFEEAAGRLAEESRLPGFLHLYVGQEAVAAGACAALRPGDQLTSTHRGHGHLLALGGDLRAMMAELMGKATGYCKGKGGSMHISDLDLGMLGANGIVGAGVPIAVGAAFANAYRADERVAMAFFGDGSTNIGAFHEAVNMAAALRLPIVFVCENNEYAEYTPRERSMAIADVADRAAGYGIPGVIVDGMDVVAVHQAARAAVAAARRGDGPTLIECKTYRYFDHSGVRGLGVSYRDDAEVATWRARDPIAAFEATLASSRVLSKAKARQVWDDLVAEVDDAIAFAEASPDPDPAGLLDDVYTIGRAAGAPAAAPLAEADDRVIGYNAAFTEGLRQLLEEDPDIFVAGEDVGHYGGVFRSFQGLHAAFGDRRVVDTPIAEQAIVGLGIGAAACGLRPVVDLMFMDFVGVAMDQLANQAAKMKYMYGGTATLPLTITTTGGAGLSAAAQHSQSLEAWLAHVPGLKVVVPSGPYEAKGLLVAAVRDDNPTVVVLHKAMLGRKGPVPVELYELPLGEAAVVREGVDVTIVAIGRMVHEAQAAAEVLAADGIEAEVIDPRTVQPFDTATVVASARKTNRILIVHEAVRFGGFGAEIAAQIQEEAFDHLDAPVARVGAPFAPVPFSPTLGRAYVPDADRIVAEARRLLARPGL